MNGPRGALGWLGQVLAWSVVLGVAGVLALAVLVPRVAGATPYAVLTGSMAPTYPAGTLVVVRPSESGTYATGDVITYQLRSGRSTVVTHRVAEARSDLRGQQSYLTRGDANTAIDAEPVLPVQIRGEVWYAVPHLGHLHTALTGSQRQSATTVVAAGLIGYAAFMLVGAVRDRRRTPELDPAPDHPADDREEARR